MKREQHRNGKRIVNSTFGHAAVISNKKTVTVHFAKIHFR